LFEVALQPLDRVRVDRAHVVANVCHADRLKQRHDLLRVEIQLFRDFVDPNLAHRTSDDHAALLLPRKAPDIRYVAAMAFATPRSRPAQTAPSSRAQRAPSRRLSPIAIALPARMDCSTSGSLAACAASRATRTSAARSSRIASTTRSAPATSRFPRRAP